jgi:hypothetical protein
MAWTFYKMQWAYGQLVGNWMIMVAFGLAIWFGTGSWIWVTAAILGWFLLPVVQAFISSRKVRFSIKRHLVAGKFDQEELPHLDELSEDISDCGFSRDRDYWLKPSNFKQGFRLFAHGKLPIYTAVSIVIQNILTFSYVIFATLDKNNKLWVTWNYPLAYGFKVPPHIKLFRCEDANSIGEMLEYHKDYLKLNSVEVDDKNSIEVDKASEVYNGFLKEVMEYNLNKGFLTANESNKDELRYSLKGSFFVSKEVLKEVVKG